MLRRIAGPFCVLACCIVLCPSSSAQDWIKSRRKANPSYLGPKVRLAIRFTPGAYAHFENTATASGITMMGRRITVKEATAYFGDVEISKPDAKGEQRIVYTCRRVKQSKEMPGMSASFDTADPADKPAPPGFAEILRPFVGWKGTLHVRDGKITRTEGVDELMKRISASVPAAVGQQLLPMLRIKMSAFLQGLLTKHYDGLMPKDPVGPGDEWKVDMPNQVIPLLGNTKLESWCLLRDIEKTPAGKAAVLDFAMETAFENRAMDLGALGAIPGEARIGKMTVRSTGTAQFDLDIGLSRAVNIDVSAKGNISVSAAQQKIDMDIDVAVKSQSALKKK